MGNGQINPLAWSARYALLDCAYDERLYDEMRASGVLYNCLLPGILPEDVAVAAPYVVKFTASSELMHNLMSHYWGKSCALFVHAPELSLFQLVLHLRHFIAVRDNYDRRLFFRFYDPRVLSRYLPSCTVAELALWFDGIEHILLPGNSPQTWQRYSLHEQSLQVVSQQVRVGADHCCDQDEEALSLQYYMRIMEQQGLNFP